MDIYGDINGYIDIYGYRYGYKWIYMDIHGCTWWDQAPFSTGISQSPTLLHAKTMEVMEDVFET